MVAVEFGKYSTLAQGVTECYFFWADNECCNYSSRYFVVQIPKRKYIIDLILVSVVAETLSVHHLCITLIHSQLIRLFMVVEH